MDAKALIKANVRSNSELMPGIRLLWVEAPDVAASAWPGKFVMVRCGEDHDLLLRRPLSIHRVDSSGGVALLFEVVGRGTRWLAERAPGDSLDVLGPLGNGFMVRPDAKSALVVAGGIGIAPLAFLAEKIGEGVGNRVIVLQGARRGERLLPRDHLPAAALVVDFSEDGSRGRRGLATSMIHDYVSGADQVFACGPAAMYRAMAAMDCLKEKTVQVSLEERMACGMGACYVCTMRTAKGLKQVCRDGPVFELADILW